MKLLPEDKVVLLSTLIVPSKKIIEILNDALLEIRDWNNLTETLIDRGIAPLFWVKLPLLENRHVVPDVVTEKLRQAYLIIVSRNTVFYNNFTQIVKSFAQHDIPVVALKGIHLAEWLYRDIGLRLLSDIDLLIREEDGARAVEMLKTLGYKFDAENQKRNKRFSPYPQRDFVHYPQMILRSVPVELHVRLHDPGEDYKMDAAMIFKNAVLTRINGVDVLTPDLHDLLIYVCVHLDKHYRGGRIQFTGYLDVANILNEHAEKIDRKLLWERCRMYGCEDVVMKHVMLTHFFMNAPVPDDVVTEYGYAFSEKDNALFLNYLRFNFAPGPRTRSLLSSARNVVGKWNKFRYFIYMTFPPKHVMIEKYKIKPSCLYRLYYPYRHWLGIKGFILLKLKKK